MKIVLTPEELSQAIEEYITRIHERSDEYVVEVEFDSKQEKEKSSCKEDPSRLIMP